MPRRAAPHLDPAPVTCILQELAAWITGKQAAGSAATVSGHVLGGAYRKRSPTDTAFPHRTDYFVINGPANLLTPLALAANESELQAALACPQEFLGCARSVGGSSLGGAAVHVHASPDDHTRCVPLTLAVDLPPAPPPLCRSILYRHVPDPSRLYVRESAVCLCLGALGAALAGLPLPRGRAGAFAGSGAAAAAAARSMGSTLALSHPPEFNSLSAGRSTTWWPRRSTGSAATGGPTTSGCRQEWARVWVVGEWEVERRSKQCCALSASAGARHASDELPASVPARNLFSVRTCSV